VGVHVIHGLATVRPGVEHDAVPSVRDALGDRYLIGMGDDVGQQPVAGGRERGQVRVMAASYHEHMYGSLRIDVAEGDRPRMSGHYGRWYVGGGDPAKQAFRHAEDLNVWQA
jgi:hypothetical protein